VFHCLVIKVICCRLSTCSLFIISVAFYLVKNFFIYFFKFFSDVCISNSDIISCLQFPVNIFFLFFQLYSTCFLLTAEKNPPHSEADLSYHSFCCASSTFLLFFHFFPFFAIDCTLRLKSRKEPPDRVNISVIS